MYAAEVPTATPREKIRSDLGSTEKDMSCLMIQFIQSQRSMKMPKRPPITKLLENKAGRTAIEIRTTFS
jgi:hypothetical protein